MRFAIQVGFEIFYKFVTFKILKSHVKLNYFPLAKTTIKNMCDGADYDYEAMGDDIALKLLTMKRVREPTLWEVQQECCDGKVPAWLQNAKSHPGLPEHYITMCAIENDHESTSHKQNIPLPKLPFAVNREILLKMVVTPNKQLRNQKIPPLSELANGTIIIAGEPLPHKIKHNIEIFLQLHQKLLPCCYSPHSEIITSSPLTEQGRVRCYYVPDASSSSPPGIVFISSQEQVLHHSQRYHVEWLHGSTPYTELH